MSLYPLHAINLNVLQVLGRSDIFLYLEIVKKIIGALPLMVGVFIDIYWMLISSIIIGIMSLYLNSYYTGKSLGYSLLNQLRDVSGSYFIGVIIALSVYFIKYINLDCWYVLSIQLVIGILTGLISCEILNIEEYKEFKNIIINDSHKTKKKL